MPQRDDALTLRQILDACGKARQLGARLSRADLNRDWVPVYALARALEVAGEGVRRLSPGLRERYPQVPWREIVGLRDRLIHGYDNVDLDRLWNIVSDDLPSLVEQIKGIIKDFG